MFRGWAHIDLGQPDDGRELFLPLFTVLPYQKYASHFYHILSIFYSIPYSIISPRTQNKPTRSDQTRPGSTEPARLGPTRPDQTRFDRPGPTRLLLGETTAVESRIAVSGQLDRSIHHVTQLHRHQKFRSSKYSTKWKQRILVNHCRGM